VDQITKDIISWDIVNWSLALGFWDKSADLPDQSFKCLELGARDGGLSLWLANKGYHVVCSDVQDPEPTASALHKQYGVTDQIDYEAIDAINIPYQNHFDIVIFKSIIGAVGRNGRDDLQQKCINEVYKCLKPGGQLLFAENLQATKFHQFLRHKFVKWSKSWNYLEINEIGSLLSEFNNYRFQTAGFLGLLGSNEPIRKVLGHVDKSLFNNIIPKKGRYIIFCVATK